MKSRFIIALMIFGMSFSLCAEHIYKTFNDYTNVYCSRDITSQENCKIGASKLFDVMESFDKRLKIESIYISDREDIDQFKIISRFNTLGLHYSLSKEEMKNYIDLFNNLLILKFANKKIY